MNCKISLTDYLWFFWVNVTTVFFTANLRFHAAHASKSILLSSSENILIQMEYLQNECSKDSILSYVVDSFLSCFLNFFFFVGPLILSFLTSRDIYPGF